MPKRRNTFSAWKNLRNHRYLKRRKTKKEDDKRGKHTKQERDLKRQKALASYRAHRVAVVLCSNCGATSDALHETADGDGYVCYRCGMVQDEVCFGDTRPMVSVDIARNCYRHVNYLSEKLKQATNTEPSFTRDELLQIKACHNILVERSPDFWTKEAFCKAGFAQICGFLDKAFEGEKWKQKLERWFQAYEFLFGPVPDSNLLDLETEKQIKMMYEIVATVFEHEYKDKDKRHNMPSIDLVILVLLYNVSEDALCRFGWHFMNTSIYWDEKGTRSSRDYLTKILWTCNHDRDKLWFHGLKDEAKEWLRLRVFGMPDKDELNRVCMSNDLCVQFIEASNMHSRRFSRCRGSVGEKKRKQ